MHLTDKIIANDVVTQSIGELYVYGQVHMSLVLVTLKKMKYCFFALLHSDSVWYGDTLCQFLGFESKAHTPR